MAFLRRCAPLLIGALLAASCRDPAPPTGSLVVTVTGLPAGANAAVRVLGPNSFFQLVRSTTTLENLAPGAYVIARDSLLFSNNRYGVDSASVVDTVNVTRGRSESISAAYLIASGSLTIAITGLPEGIGANVLVQGPTPHPVVPYGTTLVALKPGVYTITAPEMSSLTGDRFAGAPFSQAITVSASLTPAQATVNYVPTSGTLSLTVNGLPAGHTTQPIRVTGPNGFDYRTSQSVVLRGLAAGTYDITAATVSNVCPDVYTPADAPQSHSVSIGQTSNATITYTQSQSSAANLNLTIDRLYVTQATQRYDGTVPLIAGKTALIRVFGSANQCNTVKPKVRVTLSTGAQYDIDAQEDSVRQAQDESKLSATWNVVVPGSVIQPGMTIFAEMDPTNVAAEANESDNRLPAAGATALTVHAPAVGLRLVPITQSVNSRTGNVSPANLEQYMELSRKLHPVSTYDIDFRAPYTTTRPVLTANGFDNWVDILEDLNAVRIAEQTARYYYGVVQVTYGQGIAGVAYVGGKTGLGWDYLPSATRVLAHEIGHNFGRDHSPCGSPDQLDPQYPSSGAYVGGRIGVFGWDPIEGLKAPDQFCDVMGYASTYWISDYTYVGVLNWLTSHPSTLPLVAGAEQPSLLIWGRIENGQSVLQPAFEISARPTPVAAGPHRVTAVDANGAELFSVPFAGQRVADVPGDIETFAFTVPVSALRGQQLRTLRLTARGRTVSSVASADIGADPAVAVTRAGPRAARVRWDASRFPVVIVRDPVDGHIMSFARGGDITIATSRTELDLNFSNRLRSSRRLQRLQQ